MNIENQVLLDWVSEVKELCKPDSIYWCNGSKEEFNELISISVELGHAIKLNEEKRPNSYLFRSDPSDVARVEDRTFIASINEEDSGPTNNWENPVKLKEKMRKLYDGSMKGRTMYIVPFCMGPTDSPHSKLGVEITDSIYVVCNMHIMTRMGDDVVKRLNNNEEFVPCLHSVGYPLEEGEEDVAWPCAPLEDKYISHFPEERLIWSYGSGYGGNALLGKKCFSLRIASVMARDEGWFAEHMLILKLTNPEGESKNILAAFPSACGKTNLSMLDPTINGWKVETIGDDIAWMGFLDDGYLHAINPEAGFFGVAPGTSNFSNPSAMGTIKENTIFTNVALTDDGDVWWEGKDGDIPEHLIDWQGRDWYKGDSSLAAHPNSRFTTPASGCPVLSKDFNNPEGVIVDAILVGGRRPSTVPLVYESFDWAHGVFLGSIMGSEITAAIISDNIGTVRRDPFAMLPFIGYHVGDYLQHWLDLGEGRDKSKLPKIYSVNWFRRDENNKFIWPGFGENSRVLKWIFERCAGKVDVNKRAVGLTPKNTQFDIEGLDLNNEDLNKVFKVDKNEWLEEIKSIKENYKFYGDKLPLLLKKELEKLELRIKDL